MELETETKKEIKKWYQDKYLLVFIAILLAAIGIRFYYFLMTANEPLWWDESQYMATAKTYAGHGFEDLAGQRLPGFPWLMSNFFKLGIFNEAIMRFIALFIPSILVIVLIYFVMRQMYPGDKRIALISMAIMAVLTESLFYANRFMTEHLAMVFQLLAILLIYKAYNHSKATTNAGLSGVLFPYFLALISAIISILIRPGQMLIVPALFLFFLIINWKSNKLFSILAIIIAIIGCAIIYFVPALNYIVSSNINTNNVGVQWGPLGVFNGFLTSPLNWLFYIGFAVSLFSLFSKKIDDENDNNSNLLNILFVITIIATFMFIIRAPAYEYRWYFGLITALLAFTSKGVIYIADFISSLIKDKSLGELAAGLFIILVLVVGLSSQLQNADAIIKAKVTSYDEVKQAALWMGQNSNKTDIIFSISKPQTAYYSERKTMSYSLLNNTQQMDYYVAQNKPKFITISIFEPHPQWITQWLLDNENRLKIEMAFMDKSDKTKPRLIIYSISYQQGTGCYEEANACKVM